MPLILHHAAYWHPKPGSFEARVQWFTDAISEVRRRAGHRWSRVVAGEFDWPASICLYSTCAACGIYIHMYPDEPQLYFGGGASGLLFGYDIPNEWKPKVCDKLKAFA